MPEIPANGVRGFILIYPDPKTLEERIVFRVPQAEGGYTDYNVAHNDLEVQVVTNYASLVDDEQGCRITYPSRPREERPLAEELDFFLKNKDQWIADGHEGMFVLIKGQDVGGFVPIRSKAIRLGYERYGSRPFLVTEIEKEATVLPYDGRGGSPSYDYHDRECPRPLDKPSPLSENVS